jgi:hypothetical protein
VEKWFAPRRYRVVARPEVLAGSALRSCSGAGRPRSHDRSRVRCDPMFKLEFLLSPVDSSVAFRRAAGRKAQYRFGILAFGGSPRAYGSVVAPAFEAGPAWGTVWGAERPDVARTGTPKVTFEHKQMVLATTGTLPPPSCVTRLDQRPASCSERVDDHADSLPRIDSAGGAHHGHPHHNGTGDSFPMAAECSASVVSRSRLCADRRGVGARSSRCRPERASFGPARK